MAGNYCVVWYTGLFINDINWLYFRLYNKLLPWNTLVKCIISWIFAINHKSIIFHWIYYLIKLHSWKTLKSRFERKKPKLAKIFWWNDALWINFRVFLSSQFFQVSDDVNSIIYHELLCRIWNIGRKKIDTSSLLQRLYKSAFKSNFTLFLFLLNLQIRHYLRMASKGEHTGRNNSVGTHKGFISDTKYLILNFIFLNTQHSEK